MSLVLPTRAGDRPRTTPTNPHSQLDQNAPLALQRRLAEFMFGLADVEERPSAISVPGARAMCLCDSSECGPASAFLIGREFGHLHPEDDGSLHTALPIEVAERAIKAGWAEVHPMALRGVIPNTIVMVYGPRDDEELEVVRSLVSVSHAFARGAAIP